MMATEDVAAPTKSRSAPRGALRRNFQWTFLGNAVNAASQWGMLAVLAKLGDLAAVGDFTFGLAVAAPITTAAMLHMQQVQVTDARNEFRFQDYFGARLILSTLALIVIVAIAAFSADDVQTLWSIVFVGAAKCVDIVSDILRALFQKREQMRWSSLSLMIKGPAALLALAATYAATRSVAASSAAMAAVWLVVLLAFDLPVAYRLIRAAPPRGDLRDALRPNFDLRTFRRLVLISLPLGMGITLLTLRENIPRYVLVQFRDKQVQGVFSALAYVNALGGMVIAALGQSAAPRLARYYVEYHRGFRSLFGKLLAIGAGMGIVYVAVAATLGAPLLTILYRKDYAAYPVDFALLAVYGAMLFLMFFSGVALAAARQFRIQLVTGAAACVTTLVACYVLVPPWGLRGAVLSCLAAGVVMLGCHGYGLWRIWTDTRPRQPTGAPLERDQGLPSAK